MKANLKKALACILAMVLMLAVLPIPAGLASQPTEPGIVLGSATLSAGKFYYDSATVAGVDIRTILISFTDSVTSGDVIVLPATPAGFTVSASSDGNDYTKRINLDAGIAANAIQDYICSVGFTVASQTQSVQITISTESITQDTFYYADTGHYYQYFPDNTRTWVQAYEAAEAMTHMGRAGYLATVTSLDEDIFISSLSGGKTGWLGGTILNNIGTTAGSLYYNGFETESVVSTGWYWACGPEKGITFYNVNSLYPNFDLPDAAQTDALNTAYYYNWAHRPGMCEPNNATEYFAANDERYETCLTTLIIPGTSGKQGTVFSWNDIRYDMFDFTGYDIYAASGYYVEYGDQPFGDSGSVSNTFASAGGTLEQPHTATVNTYINGAPAAAPGTVELWQGGSEVSTANSIATGAYTAPAVDGTYDIFINSEDTGVNITLSGGDGSAGVEYYTVSFHLTETGTASGSTISATAGGSLITSGAAVLAGKQVAITATGAGATSYAYLWSGDGTSGETTEAITIPALSGMVDALCTVTGTTVQQTYAANIFTYIDTLPTAAMGNVELWQSGAMVYTTSVVDTGYYTASAINGTYDIYINNEDIGKDITISGADADVYVDYYTVSFAVQDAGAAWGSTLSVTAGGTPIVSGTVVLGSTAVTLTGHGAGADNYVYAWSGPGINGEFGQSITIYPSGTVNVLCRVTGMAMLHTATIYTYADGVLATVPGSVELWRGGAVVFSSNNNTNGVCAMSAAYGTYDVYINNEDTGVDFAFSSSVNSASVYYYTVSFAAANAGTASGSTISATANGTSIASGTAVLPGKEITITTQGSGADSYTYLWSGAGTNSETTADITIPELSSTADALCTVTGTTIQPTYAANIFINIDTLPTAATGSVELWQSGAMVYTTSVVDTGYYTASAINGAYDIYINNKDTGKDITISGAGAGVYVDYYTVSFSLQGTGAAPGSTVIATIGGMAIPNGTAVLAGKAVVLTANVPRGDTYIYAWSGPGTSGQHGKTITISSLLGTVNAVCTVTGATEVTPAEIHTYTDGAPAAVSGAVELWQDDAVKYTAASVGTGIYVVLAVEGTYHVYINNEDTGVDLILTNAPSSAEVYYYTVSFAAANAGTASGSTISATAGGTTISSGAAVLQGKAINLTAQGAGSDSYTYLWSGQGTSGEIMASVTLPALSSTVNALCTVTGTTNYAPGTLEEEEDDVTIIADGLLTQDARLYILPMPEGDTNRESLEALQSGKETAAAFEVYMEPANAFQPPLTLSFGLGTQFNGKTVYILHRLQNGNVEHFNVTVANGEAVITVQELSPFLLSLDPPVAITSQPQSVTVITGQTATFSVTATGAGPLTYQWQKKTGPSASWEDIPGAVGAEHTTSQANISNSGFSYRVIVKDALSNSVTSDAAVLTVTQVPESPETGDHSQPALYAILMLLFMAATVSLLHKRKAV